MRVPSGWVLSGSAPPSTGGSSAPSTACALPLQPEPCPCSLCLAPGPSRKDELALRNQFYGKTPQEILSEDPRPHRPAAAAASAQSDEQQLHNQIVDEIADRQSFLDDMTRLGQGHVHRQRIEGEIAERVHDLKRLEPYLQEAGSSSGGGAG